MDVAQAIDIENQIAMINAIQFAQPSNGEPEVVASRKNFIQQLQDIRSSLMSQPTSTEILVAKTRESLEKRKQAALARQLAAEKQKGKDPKPAPKNRRRVKQSERTRHPNKARK